MTSFPATAPNLDWLLTEQHYNVSLGRYLYSWQDYELVTRSAKNGNPLVVRVTKGGKRIGEINQTIHGCWSLYCELPVELISFLQSQAAIPGA